MTKRERKRRRKKRFPTGLCLGHIVKSYMTVIVSMGSYQIMHVVYAEVYADRLSWSVFLFIIYYRRRRLWLFLQVLVLQLLHL